jgi:hypothetical protein
VSLAAVAVPSFRELTPEILAALQAALASPESSVAVSAWAEKLLRYCEVYQPTLRRRACEKWGGTRDAARRMGELAQFFFVYYENTRDLRFLNIALKLADARWVTVSEELRGKIETALEALRRNPVAPIRQ